MSNLFLSTLAMMGLTFIIGFFVAGVIKIIANWADFFNFYHSNREVIRELRILSQTEQKPNEAKTIPAQNNPDNNGHKRFIRRINEIINNMTPHKRITA